MKIGDKVIFNFLGGNLRGIVTERVNNEKWKVKTADGTVYPFVYENIPKSKKKSDSEPNVWAYVVKIIEE